MNDVLLAVAAALLGSALWLLLQFTVWSLVIGTELQARGVARHLRVFAIFAVLFVIVVNLLLSLRDNSVTFLSVFGTAIALGWIFAVTLIAVALVGMRKKRQNESGA